jgi:ABC-2 type transport system permease protein
MRAKLLKIELWKQLPNSAFWILLALHGFVLFLVATNFNKLLQNLNLEINNIPDLNLSLKPILEFPDVWQNLTYIAGYLKVILALIVISSVSSEFQASTCRQNIIDGLSRRQWLISKVALALALALFSTLLVVVLGLIIGFTQGGSVQVADIVARMDYVLAYMLELFVYYIYALFISISLKRTGLSLILLLVYDLIIEPIFAWGLPESLRSYLPMSAIDHLNTFPFLKYVEQGAPNAVSLEQVVWAGCYGILFGYLSYLMLRRKDL